MSYSARRSYIAVLVFGLALLLSLFLPGCSERGKLDVKREEAKPNKPSQPNQEPPKKNPSDPRPPQKKPLPSNHIFATGVTLEDGWYDVDKLKRPEDIMACWLISASNMLQWWQDLYLEQGNTLPQGTPHGRGTGLYKSAIFDDAISKFRELTRGGNISSGLLWYIEGKHVKISNHSYPLPNTGGYLRDKVVDYSQSAFASYDDWSSAKSPKEAQKIFSEYLLERLRVGSSIGLEIKTHVGLGGSLHAITLWGAEVNDQGIVVAIYITDSDDYEQKLVRCPVWIYVNKQFNSREVAMDVPVSEAYSEGGSWAILRLFYLAPPKLSKP